MMMKREHFESLVSAAKDYDLYTCYIDNYTQMESAQEANAYLSKWFDETLMGYGIDLYIGNYANLGKDTEAKLIEALAKEGIEVEPEKQKRVWTEEEIKALVQTNDEVLYGALKKLYERQTADEKREGHTKACNGVGFNGADSAFLSSVAEFLLKRGFLTYKQKACVRRKLVKYNKQLTRIANA